MKRRYPAIIDREGDVFGIAFPDFPGCVSSGGSVEEAIDNGTEALTGHLAVMAADGDKIPAPDSLDQIERDPELDIVLAVLIEVVIPGPVKRINVTMDESLIEEIDAVAKNRSGWLEIAAREKLAKLRSVA
ncbi:MAG: type II toxin-antitoxin system HicB family antitoxin [Rhodospirillales bacterium]|nr:type II toxin-antitoxin system HicB family antitoxin [Rhodospirillales bacterium]